MRCGDAAPKGMPEPMSTPQQLELARSGRGATVAASAKTRRQGERKLRGAAAGLAPVPEANRPGHHPEHESDKPVDEFVAKARRLAAEAAGVQVGRPGVAAAVPLVALVDAARRPDRAWESIGESRWPWMACIALLPFGALLYDTRVRPRLAAVA